MQTKIEGKPAPKANCLLAIFHLLRGIELELIQPNEEAFIWCDHLME